MASIRDIYVRLGVRSDPRGFQRATQGINNIKSSAITLGRVLVTGAVALGFKKMIDVASDIEETANKFGAVFGAAGDSVQSQLDDIRKRTGATNLQLQEMSSNIGALIKPALGSAAAAGEMAAGVSELALDIASFNNVAAEDAIVALRSGLIGSAEPLQRFGVDTRVAALELEAMSQGLTQSVKDMTEGQRVALRYAAIQKQLGSQGATGDATKTAKGFANASRNLGQAMKETAGIIGTFFLKSTGNLVNRMRELVDIFQKWLAENRKLIQQRVTTFLSRASRIIGAVVDATKRIVGATRDWINDLGPLGKQLLKIATIVGVIAVVLLLPGGAILLLSLLVGLLVEDFEVWRKGGESVIGDIIGFFDDLIETIASYKDALLSSLEELSLWVKEHETGITLVSSLAAGLAIVIGVGLVKANAAALASWIALKAFMIQYYAVVTAMAIKSGLIQAGIAIKNAALWLAGAALQLLVIGLWAILIGTVIFLGVELVKLLRGQENFFSTMFDGISDLIEEWGGIGPAIGAMLDEALRFWLQFFGLGEKETDEWVENLTDTLNKFWPNVIDFWKQQLMEFFGWIDSKVSEFVPDITGFIFDDEDEVNQRAEKLGKEAIARRRAAEAMENVRRKAEGLPTLKEEREQQRTQATTQGAAAIASVTGPAANVVTPSVASGGNVTTSATNNINVEVKAAPGMSVSDLAEQTAEKIVQRTNEAERRQAAKSFALAAAP